MQTSIRREPFTRNQPWRRSLEWQFWVLLILINCGGNTITIWMEIQRSELDIMFWQPLLWEFSSGAMWLLLIPCMVWYTRRHPLHLDTWRRLLPRYLLLSVLVSLLHVVGMVALRKLVYQTQGLHYDFGNWPRELLYEYLKDVRSVASVVAVVEGYRFVQRRLRGEAQLLAAPDEGPPVEPVERPERFLVRKLGRDFLVATADIEYAQAAGNYVNLHVRGHDYPLRSTMAGLESRLQPEVFVRVHRSYLLNLAQIASIEPLDAGEARIHLRDGSHIPCSRRYLALLRSRLG